MEKFLSVDEVAAALDMNPESVRRCLRKGNLQGRKEGRDWQIPESELAKKYEMLQHYRVFCKTSRGATWESSVLVPQWQDGTHSPSRANQAIPSDSSALEVRHDAAAAQDAAVSVALAVSGAKQAHSVVVSAIDGGRLSEREYEIQIYPQLVFLRELTYQIEETWKNKTAIEKAAESERYV